MKKNLISLIYFVAPLLILLIVWEIYSAFGGMNSVLVSRPSSIALSIANLFSLQTSGGQSVLVLHIVVSLYRLFVAIMIACVAGFTLGILMGLNRSIFWFFDPIITIFMSIPAIAWAPIFMIWMGFGDIPIITSGALAAFFPLVYNIVSGIRSTDKKLVWAARSAGINERDIFIKVHIPSAAVYIITGFKLAFSQCWRTIIAVELLAATIWGLGYMIFEAREYLRPSIIFAGIIIMGVVYLVIERVLIGWIERKTIVKWGMV